MKNVFDEITKNSTYQGTKLGKTTEQGKKTDDLGDFPIEREAPVTNEKVETQAIGELLFVDGQMLMKPTRTQNTKKNAFEYIKSKREWKAKSERRCTIVGDFTPIFDNPITDNRTPVKVTTIKQIDGENGKKWGISYEVQKWNEWHTSTNKAVEIVEVSQTRLDGDVEFRRISQKYSRYATRTIGTEEFERQTTLDEVFKYDPTKRPLVDWLEKFRLETMDLLPIEVHQAHILNKVTLVTEIFDDVLYAKAYPQAEIKKLGQMKLELF